jgi:hypothetical protein
MAEFYVVRGVCGNYECCGHLLAVADTKEGAEVLLVNEAADNDTRHSYLGPDKLYELRVDGPFEMNALIPYSAR